MGLTANLVMQLVFNHSIGVRLASDLSPARVTQIENWLTNDPHYIMFASNRSMIREVLSDATVNTTNLHKVLSYGGQYGNLVLPAALRNLAAGDEAWFSMGNCWTWAAEDCEVTDRIKHWG
ncbi:hypothetical protein PAPYR_10697 [Paratrimastix pyriformis]|uniref:Uncharacterized protein n=1 Tax=Paratrimastix pyriformis TaxID=342808 RepID=A0ABQ8UB50_9EUKA|nr:hypothetical protein PAPYR_10697 [Paratrimastix pyriformis]